MFKITRRIEIDAGHRVPFHTSKCKNLHGHRYVIEATLEAEETLQEGSEAGMVMDFGILKAAMMDAIHEVYDHRLILWEGDPVISLLRPRPSNEFIDLGVVVIKHLPTAEELARLWYHQLKGRLDDSMTSQHRDAHVNLVVVRVWETPNAFAEYPI